jgi:hypothetical protein
VFEVVKRNKRMHIVWSRDGRSIYTPPNFVRVPNRQALKFLATEMVGECAASGKYPIASIMEFEGRFSRSEPTAAR